MARYPGASWRPISMDYLSGLKIVAYNRCNLHIAAGNGSLFNFFNGPGKASSHFWVAKSGLVEQYVDTIYRAEADLQGNDATISIETEGSERWTDAQVQAIIKLVQWILSAHNIPVRLATDSQVGPSSHGLSWHRQGIDGNFPPLPSRYAGRIQRGGGMRYSTSTGKVCPIESNIDLIFDVIFPALVGEAGNPIPPVVPPPVVQPPPVQTGLSVDGQWGAGTTRRLQQVLGTPVDGVISHQWKSSANENIYAAQFDKSGTGSTVARAIQARLGIKQDGLLGSDSIKAMQRHYGTPVDGVVSPVSAMVKAMQTALNAGTF